MDFLKLKLIFAMCKGTTIVFTEAIKIMYSRLLFFNYPFRLVFSAGLELLFGEPTTSAVGLMN